MVDVFVCLFVWLVGWFVIDCVCSCCCSSRCLCSCCSCCSCSRSSSFPSSCGCSSWCKWCKHQPAHRHCMAGLPRFTCRCTTSRHPFGGGHPLSTKKIDVFLWFFIAIWLKSCGCHFGWYRQEIQKATNNGGFGNYNSFGPIWVNYFWYLYPCWKFRDVPAKISIVPPFEGGFPFCLCDIVDHLNFDPVDPWRPSEKVETLLGLPQPCARTALERTGLAAKRSCQAMWLQKWLICFIG